MISADSNNFGAMPRVQVVRPITQIAILATEQTMCPYPWGNILSSLLGSIEKVIICYELQGTAYTWTTLDIDMAPHLGTAKFIEHFGGIIAGTAGATDIGNIIVSGGDITDQLSAQMFVEVLKTDLLAWLADPNNFGLIRPVPGVAVMATWPRGLPARVYARYDELHPAHSNGDTL